LFTFVLKIGTMVNKGLRRSHRMQWFPPKGYKPIPPNSPEETYYEDLENYSDAGNVATPLIENPKRDLVKIQEGPTLTANLDLTRPHDPLII